MTEVFINGNRYVDPTAYIYARVSTEEQAQFGHSIDTQLEAGKKWCEDNNIAVIEIFKDEGCSGTTVNRPAFRQMLGGIEFDRPTFIVVYDPSRLTRNQDMPYVDSHTKATNTQVYFLAQGVTANSTAGRYVTALNGVADQQYVEDLHTKTKEGVHDAIDNGKHVGKPVVFAFFEDVPGMPKGRIIYQPYTAKRVTRANKKLGREKKVELVTVQPTVIKSEKELFELADKGASIEVIALHWKVPRKTLSDVMDGGSVAEYETIIIPNRKDRYKEIFNKAKKEHRVDLSFVAPYRHILNEQKKMARSQYGEKGSKTSENPSETCGEKGVDE